MNAVVVDTDVVSFLFKKHPIGNLYERELAHKGLVLSFMTVAELERWAIQARWGDTRRNWLYHYLEPFVVLPYNRTLCKLWAEVTVAAQAKGRRIDCADAWIAAAALRYGLPLVTHNPTDYAGVSGLRLVTHAQS